VELVKPYASKILISAAAKSGLSTLNVVKDFIELYLDYTLISKIFPSL